MRELDVRGSRMMLLLEQRIFSVGQRPAVITIQSNRILQLSLIFWVPSMDLDILHTCACVANRTWKAKQMERKILAPDGQIYCSVTQDKGSEHDMTSLNSLTS